MKQIIIIILLALLCSSCKSYREFYRASNALVNEVIESDDAFFDTIGEGDGYDNYRNAIKKLPKRIKK